MSEDSTPLPPLAQPWSIPATNNAPVRNKRFFMSQLYGDSKPWISERERDYRVETSAAISAAISSTQRESSSTTDPAFEPDMERLDE